jgi:hypothetical protein
MAPILLSLEELTMRSVIRLARWWWAAATGDRETYERLK